MSLPQFTLVKIIERTLGFYPFILYTVFNKKGQRKMKNLPNDLLSVTMHSWGFTLG